MSEYTRYGTQFKVYANSRAIYLYDIGSRITAINYTSCVNYIFSFTEIAI